MKTPMQNLRKDFTEYHENGKLAHLLTTHSDGSSREYTYDEMGNELTYIYSDVVIRDFFESPTGDRPIGDTNKVLSSIEWLADKLMYSEPNILEWQKHIEQAKEMHKEEIDKAYKKGVDSFGQTFKIKTP